MKRIWSLVCAAALLLSGCSFSPPPDEDRITITASTYPIYLFACALTQGMEQFQVERLSTGSISCLHDYTLSVSDMKKLERADVLALNGAGLEDFLGDALAHSDALVVDCSAGVELLPAAGHHDHDHDHDHSHWDPHIWMDPNNAAVMVSNLAAALVQLDYTNSPFYLTRKEAVCTQLRTLDRELTSSLSRDGTPRDLITFHDGFAYFADAFGLNLLRSIEEEAGSEASAREIVEVSSLVRERAIPAVFTEVNGSDATAHAISRETGCRVAQLTLVMSGPDITRKDDLTTILGYYTGGLRANARAISESSSTAEVS